MNKKWLKKQYKYFLILALVAVLALLLCFDGTRQILFGLFGYAIFAYLIAIAVACVLWISGRKIEMQKSRVILYLGLFFAFLATLHVALSKEMCANFGAYVAGTFETATPGGVLVALFTSVLAVPAGYLPALVVFFVLTAILGLLALLPFIILGKGDNKSARIVKTEEPKRLNEPEKKMNVEPLGNESDALYPSYYEDSETAAVPFVDVAAEPVVTKEDRAYGTLFGNAPPPIPKNEKPVKKVEPPEPMISRGTVIPDASLKTEYYTNDSFLKMKKKNAPGALGILETDPKEYYQMKYGADKKETGDPVFTAPTKPSAPSSEGCNTPSARLREDEQHRTSYESVAGESPSDFATGITPFLDAEVAQNSKFASRVREDQSSRGDEKRSAVGFERPRMVSAETLQPMETKKDASYIYHPKPYKAPPIDLLDPDTEIADGEIEDYGTRKEIIERTVREFGIDGTVVNAIKGPAVTRYEMRLAPGTNVKKINGVKDNLMMDLSVSNISILAPIPGKPLVGIELPNLRRSKVSFRSMMNSPEFNKKEGKAVFVIGKTVDNRPYSFDLVDAPHMMVAGTTGSGKSVCINILLMSLLYRYSPEDIRLVLIDPKRVEMKPFHNIPHLLIPEPIVEVAEAINVLKWACKEMDRRYSFLENHSTKDIDNYNRFARAESDPKMYRIIIVIDEMADLMMRAKGQAEESIVRIAQLGRAAGIHLVLATQRPVATIITGLIKANVPTCICCTTKTNLESRIVMDDSGAENLLGRGDLYFVTAKERDKVRMQAAFIDEPEIKRVCDYIRQNNEAYFDETIQEAVKVKEVVDTDEAQEKVAAQSGEDKQDNALLRKVMITFISSQKASVSLAQKRHAIGYLRASRLIEQLEALGFISEEDGKNPRKVLISLEELDRVLPLPDGEEKDYS